MVLERSDATINCPSNAPKPAPIGAISNPSVSSPIAASRVTTPDEFTAYADKAATILQAITAGGDYQEVIGKLIPAFFQIGKGGVPTPPMWLHSINTLKARNILANTAVAAMTAAQWASILELVNNGIKADDNVFTGRSNADFLTSGTVFSSASGPNAGGGTYKISERLIQDYKTGDKRLANNFFKDGISNSSSGLIATRLDKVAQPAAAILVCFASIHSIASS